MYSIPRCYRCYMLQNIHKAETIHTVPQTTQKNDDGHITHTRRATTLSERDVGRESCVRGPRCNLNQ